MDAKWSSDMPPPPPDMYNLSTPGKLRLRRPAGRHKVTTSPHHSNTQQCTVVEVDLPFEEESVSHTRRDLRDKLNKLVRVTTEMTKKVGAGHPLVLKAKKELKRLRNLEEQLRWTALVTYHKSQIEAAELRAKQTGSLLALEMAVRAAHDSELGHGHSIVLAGKRALTVLIKANQNEEAKHLVEEVRQNLEKAVNGRVLTELDLAIEHATECVGRGHPLVQKALHDRKRLIYDEKHTAWLSLVSSFKQAIAKAHSDNDERMLEYWIREASHSKLGTGHAIVVEGKHMLDTLKKRRKVAAHHARETEAKDMLESVLGEANTALERLEVEVARETHMSHVYIGRGGGLHLNE